MIYRTRKNIVPGQGVLCSFPLGNAHILGPVQRHVAAVLLARVHHKRLVQHVQLPAHMVCPLLFSVADPETDPKLFARSGVRSGKNHSGSGQPGPGMKKKLNF
jgi:hypothetical protein